MKKVLVLFLTAIFIFGAQAYCAPIDEIVVYQNNFDIIFSDSFRITKDTIEGVSSSMTAEDVMASIEYPYGTDIAIYTKHNLVRTGKLCAGDYLIAKNSDGETKFTFPDLIFDSLYSETAHIDNENQDITGIAEGMTAQMLIKTFKGKDGLTFGYTDYLGNEKALTEKIKSGDILVVSVSEDISHSYELKKIPHENTIVSDDFDSTYPQNWFNDSGALRKNSAAVSISNGALKISDANNTENVAVRHIPEQNGLFIIDQSVIYNYIAGTAGASSYIAPCLYNKQDSLGRTLNRDNKYVMPGYYDGSKWVAQMYNRPLTNGIKYYQRFIVDIQNNRFSLYINGKAIFKNYQLANSPTTGVNRLSYAYYNSETKDYGNYMLIDDLRVYTPKPVLGAVLYDSENKKIDLVYSENTYEYPNLTESDVTVEDELGEVIETTFSVTDNICSLSLSEKLKDGNYKVTIREKPYYITVGEAPYEINYAFAQKKSDGAKCELSIRNRTLSDKDGEIFAVLFDSSDRLVGVQTTPAKILSNDAFETVIDIPKGKNPSYVKLFLWDTETDLVPLAKAYIYEFND